MSRSKVGLNLFSPEYFQPGLGYLIDQSRGQEKPNGMVWGEQMPWRAGDYKLVAGAGAKVSGAGAKLIAPDVLRVSSNGIPLTVKFDGQEPAWKLLSPGHGSDAATFTDSAHVSWASAGIIRDMDWGKINGSSIKEFADMPTALEKRWASNMDGAPRLPLMEYCKRTGTDFWTCIPHQMSDDGILKYAQQVGAALKGTGVRVFTQFSNELWNSQFPQYKYVESKGGAKFDAARSLFIARAFKTALGEQACPIIAMGPGDARNQELIKALGSNASEFYGAAIAPYFGSSLPASTEYAKWTPKQFAQFAYDSAARMGTSASNTTKWITGLVEQLRGLGLKLCAYECGLDFGQGTVALDAKVKAQLEPLTGQAVALWFDKWFELGGSEANYFNAISLHNKNGVWGLETLPGQRGEKWGGWNLAAIKHQQPAPIQPPAPIEPETVQQAFSTSSPDSITWMSNGTAEFRWHRPSPVPDVVAILSKK